MFMMGSLKETGLSFFNVREIVLSDFVPMGQRVNPVLSGSVEEVIARFVEETSRVVADVWFFHHDHDRPTLC